MESIVTVKGLKKRQGPTPGIRLREGRAYRENSYSKMSEKRQKLTPRVRLIQSIVTVKGVKKRQGSTPGVCLREASVKRELTVPTDQLVFVADQIALLKPFLSILFNQPINQSFILTRQVEELKNSFKIRTCITKIPNSYSYIIILLYLKDNSIDI